MNEEKRPHVTSCVVVLVCTDNHLCVLLQFGTLWPLKPVENMGVNNKTSTYFLIPGNLFGRLAVFRWHAVFIQLRWRPGVSKSDCQNNIKVQFGHERSAESVWAVFLLSTGCQWKDGYLFFLLPKDMQHWNLLHSMKKSVTTNKELKIMTYFKIMT